MAPGSIAIKRLKISIIDLVGNKASQKLYSRAMKSNYASIMPQVLAVWCEELGHEVRFSCGPTTEAIKAELNQEIDILVLGAFTHSAQFAYALSNLFRQQGAVTVLGGPHARSYPEDAAHYFDFVLGLTDKEVVRDLLADGERHRPIGRHLCAREQPTYIPGIRERWKFIEPTIARARGLKLIPMLGSTGCPYTCSFCIDSAVPYKTLGFDQIKEDLRFLRTRVKRPVVGWHDPNFGVRFDEYLSAIEEAVPPGSVNFAAESSLSLLSESRLKRLNKNGFIGMLPGIESWYSLGNKSKTGNRVGMDKVREIADQVNLLTRYIPYVQTNFVVGLDCDYGSEPFELTKRFLDLAPGAFPAFSMLTAYGKAAPQNLEFQSEGRVLPVPFHFLNNTRMMNVRLANYDWPEFFDLLADLTEYVFSPPRIYKRLTAATSMRAGLFSLLRSLKTSKQKRYRSLQALTREGQPLRAFMDGESSIIPEVLENAVRDDLGEFWQFLPAGALSHDHSAYLNAQSGAPVSDSSHELSQPIPISAYG